MKRVVAVIFGFCLLGVSMVHAEEKLPDAMPKAAAQDLDYALLKRADKTQKIVEELQKRLQVETAAENKIIETLAIKYHLRFDDKGKPIDRVDAETGKITRAITIETPPQTAPAKATKTAKAGDKK